jgi:hypothetical protein
LIRNEFTADITTDVVPARVVNLHRVRNLPALGALIAALLGIVLLAYTLAVGVRARTRHVANDFGVGNAATLSMALVLLVPATLAVGLLASIIPARRARHDDVATLLRVE